MLAERHEIRLSSGIEVAEEDLQYAFAQSLSAHEGPQARWPSISVDRVADDNLVRTVVIDSRGSRAQGCRVQVQPVSCMGQTKAGLHPRT